MEKETSGVIKLPGLIDVHVHLRDPGQTHKEDFLSGTAAALAGGFTTVLDMPNNLKPIVSPEALLAKIKIARTKTVADIGFHYGSLGDNLDTFEEAARYAVGLKLYLNHTTGGYLLDSKYLRRIYLAWPREKPVLLHAEEDVIDTAIEAMKGTDRLVHICHLPGRLILQKVISARHAGYQITCGVCPHHLFLTEDDLKTLGMYGKMLPPLKTMTDRDFLWEHLDEIDVIESDHAPHSREEKTAGAYGVPGLETTLPLLLSAKKQSMITLEQIIDKCHKTPAKIFGLEVAADTYIEVDMSEYEISEGDLHTKCRWTPFVGRTVNGKVIRTVIRGNTAYQSGKILARPGSGRVLGASA